MGLNQTKFHRHPWNVLIFPFLFIISGIDSLVYLKSEFIKYEIQNGETPQTLVYEEPGLTSKMKKMNVTWKRWIETYPINPRLTS